VPTLVQVLRFDMNLQRQLATGGGGEAVVDMAQVPGNQGKQVTGFGEWIHPGHPVAPVRQLLPLYRVAVGEQHRVTLPIGDDGGNEPGHHIRAVQKPGDTAKPLGLALGAEHATRAVQPLQGGIILGSDPNLTLQHELGWYPMDGQPLAVHLVARFCQWLAIQSERDQLQPLTVQKQRLPIPRGSRVTAQGQLRVDPGLILSQIETQDGMINQELRWVVVLEVGGLGGLTKHGRSLLSGQ
jgi:hypothetical protein